MAQIYKHSWDLTRVQRMYICLLSLALLSERQCVLRKFPGPWAESAGSLELIAPQVTLPYLAMTPRGGAAEAPGGVLVIAK